ncbi:hypothetical protein [Nonomuraea sp. NPDC049625]
MPTATTGHQDALSTRATAVTRRFSAVPPSTTARTSPTRRPVDGGDREPL